MINKKTIILDAKVDSKDDVIRILSERALELGNIEDLDKYIEVVNKREETFSTAIGYGVSIPHGKSSVVKNAFIGFLRSEKPFIWDKEQNEPVNLTFLLGVPEDKQDTLHLKILAQISKKLMNEEFRQKLIESTEEEVFNLLDDIQKSIA